METIRSYERWLVPRVTLRQGDDAALARLIRDTRAPAPVLRGELETVLLPPRGSLWDFGGMS